MRKHAHVVVVGGGILGCGVAAELAGRGAAVVLVERGQIAAGASGRNHGLIFKPEHPQLGGLAHASAEIYRELATRTALDLSLDEAPRGLVIAVAEESQWPAAAREATAAARVGTSTQRLDEAGLRELEPALAPGLLGGFLIEDGIRIDPAALTLAFAEEARAAGAEVLTHTEVKQVLVRKGRVQGVATDDGIVAAATVVNAAGPWAARLARTAQADVPGVPIAGIRGWLLLTDARPGLLAHLVESAGWHLAPEDPGPGRATVGLLAGGCATGWRDIGSLIQQNRGGHILLGGSRAGSLTDEPEGAEVVGEIARRAAALVPALADIPVTSAWSGVRPTSPDGLPLIGWVPGIDGLFLAGGHGGQGVTLGGGSARLAAQMMLGEAPFEDPAPFDPIRFAAGSVG